MTREDIKKIVDLNCDKFIDTILYIYKKADEQFKESDNIKNDALALKQEIQRKGEEDKAALKNKFLQLDEEIAKTQGVRKQLESDNNKIIELSNVLDKKIKDAELERQGAASDRAEAKKELDKQANLTREMEKKSTLLQNEFTILDKRDREVNEKLNLANLKEKNNAKKAEELAQQDLDHREKLANLKKIEKQVKTDKRLAELDK